jgi:hypothetical protein
MVLYMLFQDIYWELQEVHEYDGRHKFLLFMSKVGLFPVLHKLQT